MHTAPATVCPAYCKNVHDEQPGQIVVHETAPVYIDQIPDPRGPYEQVLVQMSQAAAGMGLRLHIGSYEFDLQGAEALLASVAANVALMRSVQDQITAARR